MLPVQVTKNYKLITMLCCVLPVQLIKDYKLIMVRICVLPVPVIKDYKLIMVIMLCAACAGDQRLQAGHGHYVACFLCR